MSKLAKKLSVFDKADSNVNNSGGGNPPPKDGDASGGSRRNRSQELDDKTNNEPDGKSSGRNGLALKVIGTPSLLKTAQQLFTLAIGEDNEDHSRYAEFLIDLDGILRKYGAKSSLSRENAEQNGEDHDGSDEDFGDPDSWK